MNRFPPKKTVTLEIDIFRFRAHERADHSDQASYAQQRNRGQTQWHECAEPVLLERVERWDDHGKTETDAEARCTYIGHEALVDVRDNHAPWRRHEHGEHADEP